MHCLLTTLHNQIYHLKTLVVHRRVWSCVIYTMFYVVLTFTIIIHSSMFFFFNYYCISLCVLRVIIIILFTTATIGAIVVAVFTAFPCVRFQKNLPREKVSAIRILVKGGLRIPFRSKFEWTIYIKIEFTIICTINDTKIQTQIIR